MEIQAASNQSRARQLDLRIGNTNPTHILQVSRRIWIRLRSNDLIKARVNTRSGDLCRVSIFRAKCLDQVRVTDLLPPSRRAKRILHET